MTPRSRRTEHSRSDRGDDRRASGDAVSRRRCRATGAARLRSSSSKASRAASSKRSVSPRDRARSSGLRDWKGRASPHCSACCSAPASRARGRRPIRTARGLPRSATEAARRGVCMVPADRRRDGLMLDQSILFNISQVAVGALNGGSPCFSPVEARRRAHRADRALRIKTRSPDAHRQSPVWRQSAESGDRQMAGDLLRGSSCSTIRPAAWTSAPSGRSTN